MLHTNTRYVVAAAEATAAAAAADSAQQSSGVLLRPGGRPWLAVGIPTMPRRGSVTYLTRTLESLMEELPADPTGENLE